MYNRGEAKQLRVNFWTGFGYYCKHIPYFNQRNNKWILYHTKIKNLELKFEVDRFSAKVIIEVNHKSEDHRLHTYEQLLSFKTIIEDHFDTPLTWDYLYTMPTGKEVCRVYCENTSIDFHRQDSWPSIYKYLSHNMVNMEKAFMEIKEFIKPYEMDEF